MQTIRCRNCNNKLAEIDCTAIEKHLSANSPILAIKCKRCKIIHIVRASELPEIRLNKPVVLREVVRDSLSRQ